MDQITDTTSFGDTGQEAGSTPIEERPAEQRPPPPLRRWFEEELTSFLGRLRYDGANGARQKAIATGTGTTLTGHLRERKTVRVPRARLEDDTGKVYTEWRSKALLGGGGGGGGALYQRLTKRGRGLTPRGLSRGTNTGRVKRAAVRVVRGRRSSKDVVSRACARWKVDWDVAW